MDLTEGEAEEYQAESARLTSRAALQRFAAAEPVREAALEADGSSLHPEWVDFGKWSEAVRVAAATRTAAFFGSRANRRFLAWLRRGGLVADLLRRSRGSSVEAGEGCHPLSDRNTRHMSRQRLHGTACKRQAGCVGF